MSLQPGKLPAAMLSELLATITHRDPRVLVGPGVGRDAAVIEFGDRMLVAKTDPVTFAAEDIGWYAVHVNANDIACMGARPAWFMATALLPPGARDDLPRTIFGQLNEACAALGIELVGGHTEVTVGLDRPIVVGAMLGEASRDEIVRGEGVQPGDAVVLTKEIAIEGTALLARDCSEQLVGRGVRNWMIWRAGAMLRSPGISVVADARELCRVARPRIMHDPTEGGLATALWELAGATGTTIRLDRDSVPIYPETEAICAALGLDPMGLLASGALLAIISADDEKRLASSREDVKIEWRRIGTVEHGPARVIMGVEASTALLPTFARDEIARFLDDDQGSQHAD